MATLKKRSQALFPDEDDSDGDNDSDTEEGSDREDDRDEQEEEGIDRETSEDEEEDPVARKVAQPRANHQSQLKGNKRTGRKSGGDRPADMALKALHLFDDDQIEESQFHNCSCGGHCCSFFDVDDIRMMRSQTHNWLPNSERSRFVHNDLHSHIQCNPLLQVATAHCFILRTEVCCDAFIRHGSVHPSTKKRILAKLAAGQKAWEDRPEKESRRHIKAHGTKQSTVLAKILKLCLLYGDEQPDDKAPHYSTICVDPGVGKGELYYNEYLDECITDRTDPCSYSYWIWLWGQHYEKNPNASGYKIQLRDEARKKRFHECGKCGWCKKELTVTEPEDHARRKEIRDIRAHHYKFEVRVEKQGYYTRRLEGKETMREDHGVLSLILDGEDQGEHQYPHQPRPPEWLEHLTRIKLKVQGVFIHGLVLLLYIIPPWLGSGASMACTVLLHAIWMAKDYLGKLPSRLYVQSDNGSENKNRCFLYLLCCLVWFRVFTRVEWHLLPPGHTHEDIDAWFSVISRWLVRVWLMTLSEMLKKLPQAFTEKHVKVHLIWVSCFFNVWDFFDKEHMGGFTGITQAHSFQVGLNCDGAVSVWYNCTSHGPGIEFGSHS